MTINLLVIGVSGTEDFVLALILEFIIPVVATAVVWLLLAAHLSKWYTGSTSPIIRI